MKSLVSRRNWTEGVIVPSWARATVSKVILRIPLGYSYPLVETNSFKLVLKSTNFGGKVAAKVSESELRQFNSRPPPHFEGIRKANSPNRHSIDFITIPDF